MKLPHGITYKIEESLRLPWGLLYFNKPLWRMKFDSKNVAFARHETFALRYGWIPKGFAAAAQYPQKKVFESEDATAHLGVGKNMVLAIRYWLRACQIIEEDSYQPTQIGKLVFSEKGYDPYLEDDATIWLIHWLLATSPRIATTWYWFFNCFHRPHFTAEELQQALESFINEKVKAGKRPAKSSIKSDVMLLVRMYSQPKQRKGVIAEESLDSPLSILKLMTQSSVSKTYQSGPELRADLPLAIFGFAVASVLRDRGVQSLPVKDLMYSQDDYPAAGSVFRLTEDGFITKLEKLADATSFFDVRETAGIHQVYMKEALDSPYDLLKQHYRPPRRKKAA